MCVRADQERGRAAHLHRQDALRRHDRRAAQVHQRAQGQQRRRRRQQQQRQQQLCGVRAFTSCALPAGSSASCVSAVALSALCPDPCAEAAATMRSGPRSRRASTTTWPRLCGRRAWCPTPRSSCGPPPPTRDDCGVPCVAAGPFPCTELSSLLSKKNNSTTWKPFRSHLACILSGAPRVQVCANAQRTARTDHDCARKLYVCSCPSYPTAVPSVDTRRKASRAAVALGGQRLRTLATAFSRV